MLGSFLILFFWKFFAASVSPFSQGKNRENQLSQGLTSPAQGSPPPPIQGLTFLWIPRGPKACESPRRLQRRGRK